jgi:hypothetical protein
LGNYGLEGLRDRKDGSVRNALDKLETVKRSRKIEKGWLWRSG